MKYEKNKAAYQDDEWFTREKRNIYDINNYHKELMSQKFYRICPDDKNKYFEVTYKPNVLADPPRLMPRHSQAITGKPPEGMKPAPSGLPYLKL